MDEFSLKCMQIIEAIAARRSKKDKKDPVWDFIYAAAHLAQNTCSCPHDAWREEIELVYLQIVDAGLI